MDAKNVNTTSLGKHLPTVNSEAGASRVNLRMMIAMVMFWMPVSILIAMRSFTGSLKRDARPIPLRYPRKGRPKPASIVCKVNDKGDSCILVNSTGSYEGGNGLKQ